jgi:hypothetical protein
MQNLFVAVLGTAALALAGCGGDDTGGSASSSSSGGSADAAATTLTKAEYIARSDAICRDDQKRIAPINKAIDDLPRDSQGRGTPKDIVPYLDQALEITKDGLAKLKALPIPADGKATAERWLASTEETVAALAELREAANANDRAKALAPSERVTRLSDEQRGLAKQYGYKDCNSAASAE